MNKLIELALKYYGTNPENWTFPWCMAFLNKILAEAGLKGTESLMARSALELGEHTDAPCLGDIVVLWRIEKEGIYGHNGLYIGEDADEYFILGGNQDKVVKVKSYPKWQLLDIRKVNV